MKEWNPEDYKETQGGIDLNYFTAPIDSPYKYTYTSDSNMSIDEIAYELGKILMEDMMQEYEGKMFTIVEYRDLSAHVKNEKELKEWIEFYGSPIEIMDNQWICTFDCKYKYTGIFSGIGEMNIL